MGYTQPYMPRHHKTLAIVAIIVVGCSVSYLAIARNKAIGNESFGVDSTLPDKGYENATFGFAFSYPAEDSLSELTSRDIEIVDRATGNSLALASIQFAEEGEKASSVRAFAHAQAALTCVSRSATTSARCPDVARSEDFTTSSGVVGEVFYLTYEQQTRDATTTREAGPFYAFDISHAGAEGPLGIVLISPTHPAEESALYDTGASVALHVAQSFHSLSAAQ